MLPKLTDEQRVAIQSQAPGRPVLVEDEQSKQVFWLVAPDELPSLWANYVRVEVDRGLDAVERGEIVPWDPEAMKDRARAAARNGYIANAISSRCAGAIALGCYARTSL